MHTTLATPVSLEPPLLLGLAMRSVSKSDQSLPVGMTILELALGGWKCACVHVQRGVCVCVEV